MAAVSLLFLLSGFSGLLYEVLWAKYLALTLGNTALAQTIVLAAFLGGLALGNALLGPRADKGAPLRLYASLELAIAALGALSPSLLDGLYWAGPRLPPWARVAAASALVAAPAFLMGGTLPALAAWATGSRGVEDSVSWLYFLNSAGASLGALAGGFLLIPALGLVGSLYAAAATSAAIGLAGLSLSRRGLRRGRRRPSGGEERPGPSPDPRRWAALFLAVFVSGLASLLFETAWIRLLALVFGSSTYSFSVMLAAFIAGLALGSLWVSRGAFRALNAWLLFGLAELGLAASLALTLPLYDKLPYAFFRVMNSMPRVPSFYPLYEAVKFLFALGLMALPTACLGATLPLACSAAVSGAPAQGQVGRGVGLVFALNALGNVLGAVAGLCLMPPLGVEGLFFAGIALNLAVGALALAIEPQWGAWRKAALAGACLLAAGGAGARRPWNKMFLSMGTFRLAGLPTLSWRVYNGVFKDYRLLSYQDDENVTVSVMQYKDQKISLLLNGKADASSDKDMRTQVLLAQIPLILKPGASDVMVVGLGSGITVGSALLHPISSLDVAEISRGVVAASRFFSPFNRAPLSDPRVRLSVEDAKAFLRLEGRRYDVIISEPSNPWVAGMGALFTTDFYDEVRAHLKPEGLMVQWLHVYEMTDDTLRLILRTFSSRFKEVTVWHTYGNDVFLVGSDGPLAVDFARAQAEFASAPVRSDLRAIGLDSLGALLALQTATDRGVREMAGPGPLNRDRFPRLEYQAPKAQFLRAISEFIDERDDSLGPRAPGLYLRRYLAWRRRPLAPKELKNIVELHSGYRRPFLQGLLAEWGRLYPRNLDYRLVRVQSELEAKDYPAARADLLELLRRGPAKPLYLELCADAERELYRAEGRPELARAALDHLKSAAARPGANAAVLYDKIARVLKDRGDKAAAIAYLDKAARAAKARPGELKPDALWMEAAELAWAMDDRKALMDNLERALLYNPDNEKGKDMYRILNEALDRGVRR